MRTRLLALVLAMSLAGAACGGTEPVEPEDARANAAPGAASPSSPQDQSILGFEATTVDGAVVDVAAHAGRDVAIWFWAPW